MRIIHLTDSYYPTIGGLERGIESLAKWQFAQGHEVHVVTGEYPNLPNFEETKEGVKIWRYKMISQAIHGLLENPERPFHPTFKDPLTANQLKKIFKQIKPDIIHSHGWSMYSAVDIAIKESIPFLATAHDYGYFCAVKQNLIDGKECSSPTLGKCVKHASQHYGALKGLPIAVGLKMNVKTNNKVDWSGLSSSVTSAANRSSYEVKNMVVVPSMCPDNILEPIITPKPEFVPEGKYVAYVGGLYNEKGVGLLLQAQQELIKEGIIVPLVLVGMIKPDSPNLDLPHVYYETNQPHNVVMSVWKHSTVGVIPSVIPEAFGQVAVECLASGTPAVVAAHGGLTDIVKDGVHGLWFKPGSVGDLKEKLKKLWFDEDLRDKMATNGPSQAAKFTVSNIAPDIMRIYEKTISSY